MGKQLGLFGPTVPGPNERHNRELAEMRLQQMARDESRPRYRPKHHLSVATTCPSCGACVTLRVS